MQSTDLDKQIATALSAWLHQTLQTPPNLPLPQSIPAAVPLCALFATLSPTFTTRDYFIPSTPTSPNALRQARYNTRRLARALDLHFSSPNAPVPLSPTFKSRLNLALTDVPSINISSDSILLTLAEAVLCAAVHSDNKQSFINAVLTLPHSMQDALALSIARVTPSAPSIATSNILIEQPLDKENLPIHTTPPSMPPSKPPTDPHPPSIHTSDTTLSRKLAAAENARRQATDHVDALRAKLEDTVDAVQALERERDALRAEVATKATALAEAKNMLREAHVAAEDVDLLRVKAASAEQLEASLKRASKRLEDVADVRRLNKQLETEVAAFRESEDRVAKHVQYLETQIANCTDRAQKMAELSDQLSAQVDVKEQAVVQTKADNVVLTEKLDTANRQLASMLVQSSHTRDVDDGVTTSGNPSMEDVGRDHDQHADAFVDSSVEFARFEESVVTEQLFAETGVKMGWNDIVDCIRGVVDALNEMDEDDFGAQQLDTAHDLNLVEDEVPGVAQDLQGVASSQGSKTSARSEDAHIFDDASDLESKGGILPDFAILDSKLKAANMGVGDEFDYAANERNVKEIPYVDGQPCNLPTIRENSQVRNGEHVENDDTSYSSGYSTEEVLSEAVDETVNATVDTNILGGRKHNTADKQASTPNSLFMETGSHTTNGTSIHEQTALSTGKFSDAKLHRSSYNSNPSNVRRAASLTISVLRGLPKSPSHSARALVRQARSELTALQSAMEAMREERRNSASIGVLVQQLNDLREELRLIRESAAKKESENAELRRELNVLMKEFDTVTVQKQVITDREEGILKEKERLVKHLQVSLDAKEAEFKDSKEELSQARQQVQDLQASEQSLTEKLHEADAVNRTQEVELARVTAMVETNDMLTTQLSAVVSKTDGLTSQMSRQRETHMQDMTAAARREKELAEEARDEARRVAQTHASVLEDVRATAVAAALSRERPSDERGIQTKKSTRFGDFWRKLLHLEKTNIDFSMPSASSPIPIVREGRVRRMSRAA